MIKKLFNSIYEGVTGDPMFMGSKPGNFEYGMSFILTCFVMLCLFIFTPIWGPIYLLGKLTR